MKKILSVSFVLLVCLGLVTGCGKSNNKVDNKEEDNPVEETDVKVNTNEDVVKNQTVDGIDITGTSLIYENGLSTFFATVTNNTGEDYQLNEYTIVVKDEKGSTIISIPGYIGEVLKSGESKNINTTISEDLSNAASVEYIVNK